MPRIFVHTTEPASAAARYVRELLRGLTAQGVDVHLVCPENFQFRSELQQNPRISVCPTIARANSTRRSCVARMRSNLRFLLASCISLASHLHRGDIVHVQFVLHFPFGALFFLAAKLRGCQIVYTVHDPLPHKWLLPGQFRSLEQRALRWAYRASRFLIVHSEPGRRALVEHFDLTDRNITVIPHGPYRFDEEVRPMPESECIEFLVFGSIRENKGIDLAIEATQILDTKGIRVRLTIAGEVLNSHESDYWQTCQALIAKQPAPIRVVQSFIPDDALPALFASCNCVLLPYRNFYSDSGVAQMALANARPIVATRAGGLGALMQAANIAVEIERASVEGVMAAMLNAVNLGVHGLAQLGRSGLAYVDGGCDWGKIAALTRSVYSACGHEMEAPRSDSPTLNRLTSSERKQHCGGLR